METRAICRNTYKESRNAMALEEVKEKSECICNRVLKNAYYQQCDTIFAYYPLGNEVDCRPLIKEAIKAGKKVALPRTAIQHQMDFYEVKDLSELELGSYGIMEPKLTCKRMEPSEATLVLVPGVVFDEQGNRYGYGGGFYDRYLMRYPKSHPMALAYESQISKATLEVLETDVKMNTIVTENRVLEIRE